MEQCKRGSGDGRGWAAGALGIALVLGVGCAPTEPVPTDPIRLAEAFPAATVEGGEPATPPEPLVWSFADPANDAENGGAVDAEAPALRGFTAIRGIDGLRHEGDALVGTASDDLPLLMIEVSEPPADDDQLWAVEVRMRSSEAGTLGIRGERTAPEVTERRPLWMFPWPVETPLVAGEASQLYTLRVTQTWRLGEQPYVLIRPTETVGAEFAIESVRLVTRRGHLLSVPTGVGWHGMGEIYHESVVSRAGETVRFDLHLPERPWLDMATATLSDRVSFNVEVIEGTARTEVFDTVVDGTEHAETWMTQRVDLAAWGGQKVTLELSVTADDPNALGFWGSPTIRPRVDDEALNSPRGVVVILTDTLRRDHLPFYGYERNTAPVLSRMAEEGMLAEDALSQSTWTKLSVTSIFTSMYPTSHTVRVMADRLPASAETLAEVFYRAGHATLGLSSIPFTGKATNMHQGYEEFHESSSLPRDLNAKTARHHVDRLLPWLERHREGRFFAFLHVADPHSPYEPEPPYDTTYGGEGDLATYVEQRDATRDFIENPLMKAFGMPKEGDLVEAGFDPDTYVGYEHDAYDGSILGMDEEIGRVIEALERSGLRDQVLVAVVSDHGTEFLDHGDHFHGHTVYGELNQVPMLLWGPGFVPATRITPTVETLDLMPTVLELAGLDSPEAMQGQSLVPLWSGEAGRFRERPAVTEVHRHPPRVLPEERGDVYALASGEWKLVLHEIQGQEPRHELFHRLDDPHDQVDRAAEHPELVAQLDTQLQGWRARAIEQQLASDSELSEGMSAEELDRLRSLGYVQ